MDMMITTMSMDMVMTELYDDGYEDEDIYEDDDIYTDDKKSGKNRRGKAGKQKKDPDDYDINFIDL